jgi:GNAT superfamily N-acetyltransferase
VAEVHVIGSGQVEFAITVEEPWRNQGIGTELLDRAMIIARNRGLRSARMVCLAGNRRVQRVASKLLAVLRFEQDQAAAEFALPFATPISTLQEAMGDGVGF